MSSSPALEYSRSVYDSYPPSLPSIWSIMNSVFLSYFVTSKVPSSGSFSFDFGIFPKIVWISDLGSMGSGLTGNFGDSSTTTVIGSSSLGMGSTTIGIYSCSEAAFSDNSFGTIGIPEDSWRHAPSPPPDNLRFPCVRNFMTVFAGRRSGTSTSRWRDSIGKTALIQVILL